MKIIFSKKEKFYPDALLAKAKFLGILGIFLIFIGFRELAFIIYRNQTCMSSYLHLSTILTALGCLWHD